MMGQQEVIGLQGRAGPGRNGLLPHARMRGAFDHAFEEKLFRPRFKQPDAIHDAQRRAELPRPHAIAQGGFGDGIKDMHITHCDHP